MLQQAVLALITGGWRTQHHHAQVRKSVQLQPHKQPYVLATLLQAQTDHDAQVGGCDAAAAAVNSSRGWAVRHTCVLEQLLPVALLQDKLVAHDWHQRISISLAVQCCSSSSSTGSSSRLRKALLAVAYIRKATMHGKDRAVLVLTLLTHTTRLSVTHWHLCCQALCGAARSRINMPPTMTQHCLPPPPFPLSPHPPQHPPHLGPGAWPGE
jgi:hypothetical protein